MPDNLPATVADEVAIPGFSTNAALAVSYESNSDESDYPKEVKIKGSRVQFELTKDFLDPSTDVWESNFVETLDDITLLSVTTPRVWFPKEMSEEPKPLCSSPNGVLGYPRNDFDWSMQPGRTPGEGAVPCSTCKAAEWPKPKGSGKPPCTDKFRIVFYTKEGTLREISLGGANYAATRDFLHGYQKARMPLYSREISMTLTGHTRGAVEYCTVTFVPGDEVPEAEWPTYGEEAVKWVDIFESYRPEGYEEDPLMATAEVIN